jgi:uncharacterized protein YabE (DUF348 family)
MTAKRPPHSRTRSRLVLGTVITSALLAGGGLLLYDWTYTTITLDVNGQPQRYRTRANTVAEALAAADIQLDPADNVQPAPNTSLKDGMTISVEQAVAVALDADGAVRLVRTQAAHPLDILAEQGITIGTYDMVQVDGQVWTAGRLAAHKWNTPPRTLRVIRSVTLTLIDSGHTRLIHTTQADIGRVLDSAGVDLFLADRVTPGFSALAADGLTVTIERSEPVTVIVDGQELATRAPGPTVGDALAAVGIAPIGLDYVLPAEDAPLEPDMTIRVVRVTEQIEIEREDVPFSTVYQDDPSLQAGDQRVIRVGAPGIRERYVRVRYEDGQEIQRTVDQERLVLRPMPALIALGPRED